MADPITLALHLILLHTVDGRETFVNPEQVVSLSSHKVGEANKVLVESVECVLGLSNGKIVSVIEHCDEVQQKLEEAGK
jgi:uncharacterized protein YlzI (FlbEa/FlbD family)